MMILEKSLLDKFVNNEIQIDTENNIDKIIINHPSNYCVSQPDDIFEFSSSFTDILKHLSLS
jgi:hypothetical protein